MQAPPKRQATPAKKPDAQTLFSKQARPLLDKYCVRCHSGPDPDGGIDLKSAKSAAEALKSRDAWEKVHTNLRTKHMPPSGSKQPTQAERTQLMAAVEAVLASECDVKEAGRVTIRRLNRFEYNNTVRDLLLLDLKPADDFPSDDVGYGFDNIGDVLSISPLLMEAYIGAAEKLAEAAIQTSSFRADVYDGSRMRLDGGVRLAENDLAFFARGTAEFSHRFQRKGSYTLRLTASGDQAGPEPVRMQLLIDGRPVQTFSVPMRRGDFKPFEAPIEAEARTARISVVFVNDYYNPNDPDQRNRDRNLYLRSVEVLGPYGGADSLSASHRAIIPRVPQPGEERKLASEILTRFASKAYRRPATQSEIDRLLKLFDLAMKGGEGFESSIRLGVTAVLSSPNFLFRVELDDRSKTGDQPVEPYALSSRLSYFLWGSMPDDSLTSLAASGQIRRPEVLKQQVQRMLASQKADALAESFAMQWLELERLKTRLPDPKLFPDWNEGLRGDMLAETKLFFLEVMRQDRSVYDFIDGPYTFVNERLARHYGLPSVAGSQFRKVSLAGTNRAGLLTQGSVLAVTSNPTRTSPVKRGRWVLEQMLGAPPPPPPPGADSLSEEVKEMKDATVRQQMEMHRRNPACANCHSRMDPLGFGLENFDAIGGWRTLDAGKPVDARGELPGGTTFQGPVELRRYLRSKSDDFLRAITERMLTYALGRGLRPSDRCHVDEIVVKVKADGGRFSTLVQAIVASEPFLKRSSKETP